MHLSPLSPLDGSFRREARPRTLEQFWRSRRVWSRHMNDDVTVVELLRRYYASEGDDHVIAAQVLKEKAMKEGFRMGFVILLLLLLQRQLSLISSNWLITGPVPITT